VLHSVLVRDDAAARKLIATLPSKGGLS